MDVEKLQKINSLALELRKHNFAGDSAEAVEKAEQFFRFEKKLPRANTSTPTAPAPVVQSEFVEKKFQALDSSARKNEQELQLLRSAVKSLAEELEKIKAELQKFSEKALTTHAQPISKPKEHQAELKTEAKEPHPRQGSYTPGDVDIRKMFYFGNKSK